MKNNIFAVIILSALFFSGMQNATAQEKTIEKRIITDSTGKTDTLESVIISTTEDITPLNNMITINPLKFFFFYNINYYVRLNNTLVAGGGLQTPTMKSTKGFGFNLELRIHPKNKAMRGFYAAPNISYNSLSETDGNKEIVSVFTAGLLLGWQWFPSESFALGLGIGVDRYISLNKNTSINDYDGFAPALRFDIGYAW